MTSNLDTRHPDDAPISAQPTSWRPEALTIAQPEGAVLTPQSFRNTPFAELPLYIPTMTTPVSRYDGGLNRAALEVSGEGVPIILPGYLNQARDDYVALDCNDIRVDFHNVTEEEAREGRQIVLHVASARLIKEAGNYLQVSVARVGGARNIPDASISRSTSIFQAGVIR